MNGIVLACAALLTAHADPVPVQNMTCAAAIHYVETHRSVWWRTEGDGIVPIYPITPLDEIPSCGPFQVFTYMRFPTRDQAQCHVGYACRPV